MYEVHQELINSLTINLNCGIFWGVILKTTPLYNLTLFSTIPKIYLAVYVINGHKFRIIDLIVK